MAKNIWSKISSSDVKIENILEKRTRQKYSYEKIYVAMPRYANDFIIFFIPTFDINTRVPTDITWIHHLFEDFWV